MKDTKPPKPRVLKKRLPQEARDLQPGGHMICDDEETARCVRAHGRARGWQMVQRQEQGGVRVWRLK